MPSVRRYSGSHAAVTDSDPERRQDASERSVTPSAMPGPGAEVSQPVRQSRGLIGWLRCISAVRGSRDERHSLPPRGLALGPER